MPKTDNSITIAAWAGAFRNRDGAVRETAVYAPGGYFASTGLATMSILAGSGFYVVDGAIYDNGGARQFHIAGLWWYDRNGRPAY
jgi:hypothetical protein